MNSFDKNYYANEFSKTVQERKHKILEGTYVTNNSVLKIQCLKHEKTYEVVAKNYKISKFGIPCCKPPNSSGQYGSKKKGFQISLETRAKICFAFGVKVKKVNLKTTVFGQRVEKVRIILLLSMVRVLLIVNMITQNMLLEFKVLKDLQNLSVL